MMDQQSSFGNDPHLQAGEFWDQFSEEWQEVLTGYALGALEPDEMIALADYLQNHPELREVVQRLEETTAAMAYAAPSAIPSPAAKDALLDRIYGDLRTNAPNQQKRTQDEPLSHHRPAASLGPQNTAMSLYRPNEPLKPATKPAVTQAGRQRARGYRRNSQSFFDFATGWKVATMATAAALLFFVITTAQLTGQLNQVSQQTGAAGATLASVNAELTRMQQENEALRSKATQLAQQLQVNQQQLASLLAVSQVVELGGTGVVPGAQGALFVGEDSLVLILHGLPSLPSNQTYQLWLIPANAAPISAGLVHVADDAVPNVTVDVALPTHAFASVGLSIEPAGGSILPSDEIVLLGTHT